MHFGKWLGIPMALFLIMGCSKAKAANDATQKVIDYETGKTQVDTYQGLKKQIKTLQQQESKQFDELTK